MSSRCVRQNATLGDPVVSKLAELHTTGSDRELALPLHKDKSITKGPPMQTNAFTSISLDHLAAVTGGGSAIEALGGSLNNLGHSAAYGMGFGTGFIDSKVSQLQGDPHSYAGLDRSIAGDATNGYSRAFWEGGAAANAYVHGR